MVVFWRFLLTRMHYYRGHSDCYHGKMNCKSHHREKIWWEDVLIAMAEHARAQTHTQKWVNEYSCLHQLCFTSANSRQTFSQNAHEADQHHLPYGTWQCTVSSPHSNHQPHSLNITICLIVPSKFPFPLPLPLAIIFAAPLLLPYCVLRPEDTDPQGRLWWYYYSSWPPPPRTWMTSLCLNHPLISTAREAVHLKPAPILRDKSLLTCCFLHVLVTTTTI